MRVTEKTIQLLKDKKVYTTRNGTMRWKEGDIIDVSENAVIEPYSGIFSGGVFVR